MNCEICHLKELEVEVFQVREVLRCILHTILFHRALGLVRPKDVDSEHFEITYDCLGNRCIFLFSLWLSSGMNCEICHLKELVVEVFQVREVLRCILHTILFHRALGLVRPKDVDSEHFEITYVQCGDAGLEKKIEERIDHFYGWVEKHPNKKGQILLSFYEEKNKQVSWFTNKIERQHWEQWYINLHIVQPNVHGRSSNTRAALDSGAGNKKEESTRHASLEASLREVLFQIIKFVNEKKDHIPPVPNLDCVVSFPFEITVPSHSDSSFGVEILKRMLQTGHPTMLS